MVTIGQFRKKYGDETLGAIFKNAQYRINHGYLKDKQYLNPAFPREGFLESIDILIEILSEYKFQKRRLEWLIETKHVYPLDYDFPAALQDLEALFWECYDTFGKHAAANTSKEDIQNGNYIRYSDIANLIGIPSTFRADARFDLAKKKLEPLIRKCEFPGCNNMFIARREGSRFCLACRNKGHVRTCRENKKKILDPKKCEFCGEIFTPKTKRARFCKDVCRVRASREIKK